MAIKTPFESKYTIAASGCWEWKSRTGRYGLVRVNGVMTSAHRATYIKLRGKIPDGLELDHLCRNPLCVNPDHLEPVTAKENTRRKKATKLNVERVGQMRQRRSEGAKLSDLAEEFNLSPGHVSEICRGKYWGDASGPIAPRDPRGLNPTTLQREQEAAPVHG